ncbi:aspartate/glutamate racemase family protein [Comamonas endophytica]|uniref:Aspartate/glutamate racemase family protein n=1 Tax=Comamonas endophytica TaxID=2949090 RepID=A0ABY6GAG5_9BURK|nr:MULTISPECIES: aspartate/glutamate racemase family protein [unclassified Acidovorax]MCD2514171.1 aspartate/glutamate racemase family protein [Acidovorax sp. D4N7]UYG51310.1 aspartate/glutamate racemase family protein [Acidovorax sp. 5MLIR]
MQLLLLNPNTSDHVTQRMRQTAQTALSGAADIVGVTATEGPRIVGSRAENVLAAQQALALGVAHAPGMDAVILAISTDAGLWALREILDIPVVGMLQAALLCAAQLGQRVGLITLGAHMLPVYQEQARLYQLDGLMHAWSAPALPQAFAPHAQAVEPEVLAQLQLHAEQMIDSHDLDVLVLSGAVLSGYRAALQAQLPVPVIDGIEAAAWQAVAMARMGSAKARIGSFSRVMGREVSGMPAQLTARMRALV